MTPKGNESIPKLALTKYEMETVVNFNNAEKIATIFTCNKSLIGQLKRKGYKVITEDALSTTFECPKKCISFRSAVVKPRKVTEKQLEVLKEAREKQFNRHFRCTLVVFRLVGFLHEIHHL